MKAEITFLPVVRRQTFGESTINETNARRGIIDASTNDLISFLTTKLLRP